MDIALQPTGDTVFKSEQRPTRASTDPRMERHFVVFNLWSQTETMGYFFDSIAIAVYIDLAKGG